MQNKIRYSGIANIQDFHLVKNNENLISVKCRMSIFIISEYCTFMKNGLDMIKYLNKNRDEILPVSRTYNQKIVKDDMT